MNAMRMALAKVAYLEGVAVLTGVMQVRAAALAEVDPELARDYVLRRGCQPVVTPESEEFSSIDPGQPLDGEQRIYGAILTMLAERAPGESLFATERPVESLGRASLRNSMRIPAVLSEEARAIGRTENTDRKAFNKLWPEAEKKFLRAVEAARALSEGFGSLGTISADSVSHSSALQNLKRTHTGAPQSDIPPRAAFSYQIEETLGMVFEQVNKQTTPQAILGELAKITRSYHAQVLSNLQAASTGFLPTRPASRALGDLDPQALTHDSIVVAYSTLVYHAMEAYLDYRLAGATFLERLSPTRAVRYLEFTPQLAERLTPTEIAKVRAETPDLISAMTEGDKSASTVLLRVLEIDCRLLEQLALDTKLDLAPPSGDPPTDADATVTSLMTMAPEEAAASKNAPAAHFRSPACIRAWAFWN
jgi:hypothetical protein